jgi:hypothetical protein
MPNEADRTPSYLREDLKDLLHPLRPRHAVITHRVWMETYHNLEQLELNVRLQTQSRFADALLLWLRQLHLFRLAFTRNYDFPVDANRETKQAIEFRLDLIGHAAGNSKLALDALLAGHYSGAMALERNLLETWRRAAYARFSSQDIWRWYPEVLWPNDVKPVPNGTMPTGPPDAKKIANVIKDHGSEWDQLCLEYMTSGFAKLNDYAHPSIAGAAQTWHPDDPDRRIFGGAFNADYCEHCLFWGLMAGVMLLEEVAQIDVLGEDWREELDLIRIRLLEWAKAQQS